MPVFVDDKHAIAHNKTLIIDDAVVCTGSFNFTAAAEDSNAENLLVIQSTGPAQTYTANWQKHLAHSVEFSKYKPAKRGTTGTK